MAFDVCLGVGTRPAGDICNPLGDGLSQGCETVLPWNLRARRAPDERRRRVIDADKVFSLGPYSVDEQLPALRAGRPARRRGRCCFELSRTVNPLILVAPFRTGFSPG
jgi:hypothetical protein